MVSVGPPAENGTMIVTTLDGNDCDSAATAARTRRASARPPVRSLMGRVPFWLGGRFVARKPAVRSIAITAYMGERRSSLIGGERCKISPR